MTPDEDRWDPAFVCPICQRPSWHPRDAEERFCATCGFVDDVIGQSTRRAVPGEAGDS